MFLKRKLIVASVTLVMAVLTLAAMAQAAGFTAVAVKAPQAVTVDGDLSDWQFAKANAIVLDTKAQLTPGLDAEWSYSGPSDLSSIIYAGYDANYLYFAFDVADDAIVQNFTKNAIYKGDGPEIYLDTNPTAKSVKYTDQAWQFGATPGTDAASPDWTQYKRKMNADDVQVAAVKTEKGYTLEFGVALSALNFQPKSGDVIGFDVAVNDVDSSSADGTENMIILSGSDMGWKDPSVFVTLLFQ